MSRARQLKRELEVCQLPEGDLVEQIALLARRRRCDLLILGPADQSRARTAAGIDFRAVSRAAPCPVCVVILPGVPAEVAG